MPRSDPEATARGYAEALPVIQQHASTVVCPGEPGLNCACRGGDKNLWNFLKWRWQRLFKEIPPASAYHFLLATNDPQFLRTNRSRATITWIGHSSLLVQLGGLNILTDPHFSERASPLTRFGPQRVVPAGLAFCELPAIDLVLISHNHYDHLDQITIRQLVQRQEGPRIRFVVPVGLGRLLNKWGARHVTELAWWDSLTTGPAMITAVPVQHWSRRGPFDGNQTRWAGFVVEAGGLRFFFNGDSGYSDAFKEIRNRLGAIDVAALPIGAYEPRWFMKDHHMDSEEAVQAHLDLEAGLSIALHWGTFILTDEALDQPPRRLQGVLRDRAIPESDFRVLQHGETLLLDGLF